MSQPIAPIARRRCTAAFVVVVASLALACVLTPARAQSAGAPDPQQGFGLPSTDDPGLATIHAIKLTNGIRLDGRLDEPVYQTLPPITGFIQQIPDEGAPATEQTEAWIMFDRTHIYVSARAWDSAPPSEWVANEMRRDTTQLRDNDSFWVVFDTFHDRRNGVAFYTNSSGRNRGLCHYERRESQQRLEPGLGRAHGAIRERVDRRDGNPLHVSPLSAWTDASVGSPAAP